MMATAPRRALAATAAAPWPAGCVDPAPTRVVGVRSVRILRAQSAFGIGARGGKDDVSPENAP